MTTITVEVDGLKDTMRIVAFTGFNKSYQNMDETTSKFVRHNFKGAFVEVERKGKRIE